MKVQIANSNFPCLFQELVLQPINQHQRAITIDAESKCAQNLKETPHNDSLFYGIESIFLSCIPPLMVLKTMVE